MKYYSPATDLSALERELGGGRGTDVPTRSDDEYDDYADKYTADDEDDGEGRRRTG